MEQLRHNGDPEEAMKVIREEAPSLVIPVPRLEHDLMTLLALTDHLVPPERAVRSKCVMVLGMLVENVLVA
jgi:hypothetical protein